VKLPLPVFLPVTFDIPFSSPISVAKETRNWNNIRQHTVGHIDCPACKTSGARMMIAELDIASLPFTEATRRWLEWRESYRRKGTVANYRAHISALKTFFKYLTLDTIMPGHLRTYQEQRLTNEGRQWKRKAGPSYINHELNTLSQILDIAAQWDRLKRFYNPLPLPKKRPQRVMTEEEEQQLFEAASKNPDCYLAYLVASISKNTTATGAELRSLRLKHVQLEGEQPCIEIPHEMVKNEYRARRIPLNEIALKQVRRAIERAKYIGCCEPEDHIFPLRVKPGLYNPEQPASPSWIRKQWQVLRKVSGLPWVRPHDMRHQAITEMLEWGVNEDAVRSVAGHVSQDILRRYSHQRYAAKRAAVSVLSGHAKPKRAVKPIRQPRPSVIRNVDTSRERMQQNFR